MAPNVPPTTADVAAKVKKAETAQKLADQKATLATKAEREAAEAQAAADRAAAAVAKAGGTAQAGAKDKAAKTAQAASEALKRAAELRKAADSAQSDADAAAADARAAQAAATAAQAPATATPSQLAQPIRTGQSSSTHSYGTTLTVPEVDPLLGVEPEDVETFGDWRLVDRYGFVLRAGDVYGDLFERGALRIASPLLRGLTCDYVESRQLGVDRAARDEILFDDARRAAAEGYLSRTYAAIVMLDQTRRTGCAPLPPLPEEAARVAAAEEVRAMVSYAGDQSSALGYFTNAAMVELVALMAIFSDPGLCGVIAGDDAIERSVMLVGDQPDAPTLEEARQSARVGQRERRVFQALAPLVPKLVGDQTPDLGTIFPAVFSWGIVHEIGSAQRAGGGAREEVAQTIEANTVRFRRRVAS